MYATHQRRVEMPKDDGWIRDCITKALSGKGRVTEAVTNKAEVLLRGSLSEGKLAPKELAIIAQTLLSEMIPSEPKVERQ
jgi:hypothetical protein